MLGRATHQQVQQVLHLLHAQQVQFKKRFKQEPVQFQEIHLKDKQGLVRFQEIHLKDKQEPGLVLKVLIHVTAQVIAVTLIVVTVQLPLIVVTVVLHQYVQEEALGLSGLGQVMTSQAREILHGHVVVHDVDKGLSMESVEACSVERCVVEDIERVTVLTQTKPLVKRVHLQVVKRATERVRHVVLVTVVVVAVGPVGLIHQAVLAVLVQERVVHQQQGSAELLTHVVTDHGQVGLM